MKKFLLFIIIALSIYFISCPIIEQKIKPTPESLALWPEIDWLITRMDRNPAGKGFIWSWDLTWLENHDPTPAEQELINAWPSAQNGECYVHDQALTALVFMMQHQINNDSIPLDRIQSALDNLVLLQQSDGHFVFWSIGLSESGGSFNGMSAWAGLALTYYIRLFDQNNSEGYLQYAEKLADFLLSCQEPSTKLITMSATNENFSTEQNLIMYFFFKDMAQISNRINYNEIAEELKNAILTHMWDELKGTFKSGYNYSVDSLTCSSWGSIFLLTIGATEMANLSLQYAEQIFPRSSYNYPSISGYCRGEGYWKNSVWSAGTLGMAMAYLKLGNIEKCDEILQEILKLQELDSAGGILYNTDTYEGPEYADDCMPRAPSATGTAWFALVKLMSKSGEIMNNFWPVYPLIYTPTPTPEPTQTPYPHWPEINWLINRMDINPSESGFIWSWDLAWLAENNPTPEEQELIEKWTGARSGQCYSYDQALTALVLMMQYRVNSDSISLARIQIALDRLVALQQRDGHFVFWSIGTGDNGDSYNGASMWAGLALTYYIRFFDQDNSEGYLQYAEKLVDFLLSCQEPFTKLIALNDVKKIYSTEHNIDAFFFFKDMAHISNRLNYMGITGEIQSALMNHMWNIEKETFNRGYNDDKDALDCSSWGTIFLLAIGEQEKANTALNYANQTFKTTSANYPHISGYHRGEEDYRGNTVWSEGSLGVAMAYLKNGNINSCDTILIEMEKIQLLDPVGGLLYNTDTYEGPIYVENEDCMPRAPSAAGTAWFAMVKLMKEYGNIMNSFWAAD